MTDPRRSRIESPQNENRSPPPFDDAVRGTAREEPVDPADPGHGGRLEADRIPPEPIAPTRRWTLGAFVPVAALLGAVALAIYVFMRA